MEQISILIVEDEVVTAMELADVLTSAGYNVLPVAQSGEEALALVQASKPSLVIMDIRLDGQLDGVDTASTIRKVSDASVVYLTAFADDAIFQRAVETCPHGFMEKPFEPVELLRCVEMTLKRRIREQDLESRASLYEGQAAVINMATVLVKADGVLLRMNKEAERLTGWNSSDAIRKHITEVCVLRGPDVADMVDWCSAMPRPVEFPPPVFGASLVSRTGAVIPIELNVVPVRDSSGSLETMVFAFRDISHISSPERVWISYAFYLCKLADFSCEEGDYQSAQCLCRKARLIVDRYGREADLLAEDLLGYLAVVYSKMGEPAEALALELEARDYHSSRKNASSNESLVRSTITRFWDLLRGDREVDDRFPR